jgi:tetratricopeptide (TPR) repeat protein
MKMIKRMAALIITFSLLLGYANVPMAFGAGNDALDTAIRELSDYLNRRIPKGSKSVFLNVKSDWPAFSEYILDCLQENAVNDGVFTVVDRQQLNAIRSELNFQWSGEVSDKSAQEIGQMLGAQTIVSGLVTKVGSDYRIQVRAIAVQTAAVQGLTTKNVSNKGALVTALTTAPAASPQSASNEAVAYKNRGNEYAKKQDYNRAIEEYNKALRLDPNYADVYHNRGLTYDLMGDYERAIADFTQANRLDPNDVTNYSNRGRAYALKGDLDRGIADFTQAIRLAPNTANYYFLRGIIYAEKKDYDRAISDYEAALRIDPNHADAKQWLEQTRQARGGNTVAPAQSAKTYKVGDTGPAGGLIFYDKGNNNGGWRYLEVAPVEAEFQARWSVRGADVENTQQLIGSGKRNTQLIVEKFKQTSGEWDTAAQMANDLVFNGFNDWFLPSRAELDQMYGTLKRKNLGDFKNEYYWSSSQTPRNHPDSQNFKDGSITTITDTSRLYVRPIRQF